MDVGTLEGAGFKVEEADAVRRGAFGEAGEGPAAIGEGGLDAVPGGLAVPAVNADDVEGLQDGTDDGEGRKARPGDEGDGPDGRHDRETVVHSHMVRDDDVANRRRPVVDDDETESEDVDEEEPRCKTGEPPEPSIPPRGGQPPEKAIHLGDDRRRGKGRSRESYTHRESH